MLFGHLAISALEHRYLKADVAPVMIAAVAPDVVDKVLHYALGQTDAGRLWAHTLLAALLSTALILAVWGRRSATSWALGYLSHLLGDVAGVVPWLYPFVGYELPAPKSFLFNLWQALTAFPQILLEVALSTWAVIALWPQVTRWRERWLQPTHRARGL